MISPRSRRPWIRFAAWAALAATPALLLPGCSRRQRHSDAAAGHELPAPVAPHPAADAPLRLKLPFPAGVRCSVVQGNHGDFSHNDAENRYAWDFDLPEGSPVTAAAAGRVIELKADSTVGGNDRKYLYDANYVVLDHGRCRYSMYLHLQRNSVRVRLGDLVQPGQVLGLCGRTGFLTRPHLHFNIVDHRWRSLPARFVDFHGADGVPDKGDRCTSGRVTAEPARYAGDSTLPAGAFAENGIRLTSPVPVGPYRDGQTIEVAGRIDREGAKVVLFLMARWNGRASAEHFGTVDRNGNFKMKVTLRRPRETWEKNPNAYSLAMAIVRPDGSYHSPFSVPVSIQ